MPQGIYRETVHHYLYRPRDHPGALWAGVLVTAVVQALLLCCVAVGFIPRYSKFVWARLNNCIGYDTCSAVLLALTKLGSFTALAMFCQWEARAAVDLFHQVIQRDQPATAPTRSLLVWVPVWQLIVAGFTLYLQGFVSSSYYIGPNDHWCSPRNTSAYASSPSPSPTPLSSPTPTGEQNLCEKEGGGTWDVIDVLFNSVALGFILQLDDQMLELLQQLQDQEVWPNLWHGLVLDWGWVILIIKSVMPCLSRTGAEAALASGSPDTAVARRHSSRVRHVICVHVKSVLSGLGNVVSYLGEHIFHVLAMAYSCVLFVFMVTAFNSLDNTGSSTYVGVSIATFVVATACFIAVQTLLGLPLAPLAANGTSPSGSQPHACSSVQWYYWIINVLVPIIIVVLTRVLLDCLVSHKLQCSWLRDESAVPLNASSTLAANAWCSAF
jgi:hypothetical protein